MRRPAPTSVEPTHQRWSPRRTCALCGFNAGPEGMVFSHHSGAWYCNTFGDCEQRARELDDQRYRDDLERIAELERPTDPEYADVDPDGQLSLGVPGEQRALDGLARPRQED